MARRSVTHRRIINDKADYISGKGFTCDEAQQPRLAAFLRHVNGDGRACGRCSTNWRSTRRSSATHFSKR